MVENISSKISEKPLNLTFFEQLFNLNLIFIEKKEKTFEDLAFLLPYVYNVACKEQDKSLRHQNIKKLERLRAARIGMTGTLVTKYPLNLYDQYKFLSDDFFKNESVLDMEEEYCKKMSLRNQRGKRVVIS